MLALKMCIRFKDGVRFKEGVRFKVYQSLSRDFYIVLSCVPASSRVTASK